MLLLLVGRWYMCCSCLVGGGARAARVRRKCPSVVSCPGWQQLHGRGGEQALTAGALLGAHDLTLCSPVASLSSPCGVFITSVS